MLSFSHINMCNFFFFPIFIEMGSNFHNTYLSERIILVRIILMDLNLKLVSNSFRQFVYIFCDLINIKNISDVSGSLRSVNGTVSKGNDI